MPEKDIRLERHQALYQERDKQVTRWTVITVLFAIVVPWKVLAPYAEKTAMLADVNATLAGMEAELAETASELKALEAVADGLKGVQAISGNEPWEASIEELRIELRELNGAVQTLADGSPDRLRSVLDRDMRVQDMRLEANAMRQSAAPARDMARQAPLDTFASDGLEDDFLTAAELVGFSPVDAGEIPVNDADFRSFVEKRAQQRAQMLADQTILDMYNRVEREVLAPLERVLAEHSAARTYLPALTDQVGELRKHMEAWRDTYVGDTQWYVTVSAKFSRSDALSRELMRWNEGAGQVLKTQLAAVDHKEDELASDLKRLQAEKSDNEDERAALRVRLEKYLPDWLRGLVSPEEMFTLYAPLLLALLLFVGFKCLLVRHHFVLVRDRLYPDDLSRQDPSLSTSWTLVYRGVGGTAFTAVLYLGGLCVLWWAFEWGSDLAIQWSRLSTATGVPAPDWMGVCLWLGRVVFCAALVYVPVCLALDYSSGRSAAGPGSRHGQRL